MKKKYRLQITFRIRDFTITTKSLHSIEEIYKFASEIKVWGSIKSIACI